MTLLEIKGKHVVATIETENGLTALDISNFLDKYDRAVDQVRTQRELLIKISKKWGHVITFMDDSI